MNDNNFKILLIEDNPDDVKSIQEMINEANVLDLNFIKYNLLWGKNVQEAFQILDKEKIDIILLDLFLPSSTGLNTLDHFKPASCKIPIIVLTGPENERIAIEAVKNGAQDFLVKGQIISHIFLLRAIQYAIERKQNLDKLKESEAKFQSLSEEFSEANSLNELLIDLFTHDLKNSAGAIASSAEIILGDGYEENLMVIIKNSSDTLVNIIQNIVSLGGLITGDIELHSIDLSAVILAEVEKFSVLSKELGIDIKLNIEDPIIVKVNPIISQVFNNYISNAIKHSSSGKKIIIETSRENNSVIFAVKDFGTSIPETEYENIFLRKYQLESTNKGGRGIGLNIVRRIAEAHNGKVWVKKNEPNGNIFYLKLPL